MKTKSSKEKSSKERRAKEREKAKEREIERQNNLQRRDISTNTTTATEATAVAQAPAPVPAPAPETTESKPSVAAASIEAADTQAAAAEAVPAEPVEAPRRRSGSHKRKAAANSGSSGVSPLPPPSKRHAKEKSHTASLPLRNGPLTRARQSPNKAAAAAAAEAAAATADAATADAAPQKPTDPSPPTPPALLSVGEPAAPSVEPVPAIEEPLAPDPALLAEFEAIRSRDTNVHVVPTPAGWFSWTKVHKLEERALASFFNGKSEERTPDIYMEIRNAIMKRFHSDPQTKVELKDLSEISAGNLDARQEVMEFLDQWGLINFHPFPPKECAADAVDADSAAKTASLIEKLFRFEMVPPHDNVGLGTNSSAPAVLPRLLPESAIADELVRPEGPSVEYHCNSCSADCSRKRFHCQTQADFDLCSECYNAGKFDSGMAPADFILMESAEVPGASGGNWTDQETLLLLEALELYGENWNEIAEHVATKTKAQCILHFVQMPIEDSFLDGKEDDNGGVQGYSDPSLTNRNSSTLDVVERKDKKTEGSEEQPMPSPVEKGSSDLSVTETTEGKIAAKEDQPVPKQEGMPKPGDSEAAVEAGQEMSASFAVRALKDAFQAIGSLPDPGGLLSFADAGNPVMALVAFLAGLEEPGMAAASARSSLKAMAEDSPGIQLAARHCFLLEDPPSHWKDPPACESSVVTVVDGLPQEKDKQVSVSGGGDLSKNCMDKNNENTVAAGKKSMVPFQDCAGKSHIAGVDDLASAEKVIPSTSKVSGKSASPGVDTPSTAKKSNDVASVGEAPPNTGKESGDFSLRAEDRQNTELTKDVDASDTVSSEVKGPQQAVDSNPTAATGENRGENDTAATHTKSEKNHSPTESTDDHNATRIKRAALTALSAAAVKAKLLANQEEDEIRELVSLLIEKQLLKLETKLSLFTEMESVIMRVREQLHWARQKLYHERAQIIAARLGYSAPTSRPIAPMAPSVPMGKVPMNYVNPGPRPPIMTSQPTLTPQPTLNPQPTLAPQRPPVKRPTRTLTPSNLPFPGTTTGSSTHTTHTFGQETLPLARTKPEQS
ncbi:SWI/SNF complex subunit SWI3D isoform X2 [Magnolia sinica]|uniref:SWI/SNF complex subunit SWI3D isoform X2 n=1 Tax=Magnolia sinica TaxID=86752 RepID=UPI002657F21B|nr:SWI/SNF complex subunit SWI3D isoform X2 [Magnolia sinica]